MYFKYKKNYDNEFLKLKLYLKTVANFSETKINDIEFHYYIKNNQLALEKTREILAKNDSIFESALDDKKYFAYISKDNQIDITSQRLDELLLNIYNISSNTEIVKIITWTNLNDKEVDIIKKIVINPIKSREIYIPFKINIKSGASSSEIKLVEYNDARKNYKLLSQTIDFIASINKNKLLNNVEWKLVETYLSDHCRHSTFNTILSNVIISDGELYNEVQNTFNKLKLNLKGKPLSLMNVATIFKNNYSQDKMLNDNAFGFIRTINNKNYLLTIKNETHNHPSEIEPFGGAATCIGGAIRDPLALATIPFQSMRISGVKNPLENYLDTLPNKQHQAILSKESAKGFSSYANQIGIPCGYVNEIYDEGFVAKKLELGVVVGIGEYENNKNKLIVGDVIYLLGNRTGIDGIGGATGSSIEMTNTKLSSKSTEVQEGEPTTEKKLLNLFSDKNFKSLIKQCNDLGAGGISVGIVELSESMEIDLKNVKVKQNNISPYEILFSESQERMGIVIANKDIDKLIKLLDQFDVEGSEIGKIRNDKKILIKYGGESIVNLSVNILNLNNFFNIDTLKIETRASKQLYYNKCNFKNQISILNESSKKGISNFFDSSIGGQTILAPYGGKYQATQAEGCINRLPIKHSNYFSSLSFGYNPLLSYLSPYLAGIYAVVESINKQVCMGNNINNIKLSFQEYFPTLNSNSKWSSAFLILLGATEAQEKLNVFSGGGKDSVSGTYNNIDVPFTLISIAWSICSDIIVVSPELKSRESYIYLLKQNKKVNFYPNFKDVISNINFVTEYIKKKIIISAKTIETNPISDLKKMALGNQIGFKLLGNFNSLNDFLPGTILIETTNKIFYKNAILIAETIDKPFIEIKGTKTPIDTVFDEMRNPLSKLYQDYKFSTVANLKLINKIKINSNSKKVRVLILEFPGTNGGRDIQNAFDYMNVVTKINVIKTKSKKLFDTSIDELEKDLNISDILVIPGGFSFNDEPFGAATYISEILNIEKIRLKLHEFMKKDKLILGICNGFQALLKTDLLWEYDLPKPKLVRNINNDFISTLVNVEILESPSIWTKGMLNNIFLQPIAHQEGRFIISKDSYDTLVKNKQIVSRYHESNLNGSDYDVEAICSKNGNVIGMMTHPERINNNLFINVPGEKEKNIFINAINYIRENNNEK